MPKNDNAKYKSSQGFKKIRLDIHRKFRFYQKQDLKQKKRLKVTIMSLYFISHEQVVYKAIFIPGAYNFFAQ